MATLSYIGFHSMEGSPKTAQGTKIPDKPVSDKRGMHTATGIEMLSTKRMLLTSRDQSRRDAQLQVKVEVTPGFVSHDRYVSNQNIIFLDGHWQKIPVYTTRFKLENVKEGEIFPYQDPNAGDSTEGSLKGWNTFPD